MSAPRAAVQLLRMPVSLGYSFRPLLRGRGRRSASSLPRAKHIPPTDHLMSRDFELSHCPGSRIQPSACRLSLSPPRRRRVRARPINAKLAMGVTPAEELDGPAQIPPAVPLERGRNLALPFHAQQPVHVHRFNRLD